MVTGMTTDGIVTASVLRNAPDKSSPLSAYA